MISDLYRGIDQVGQIRFLLFFSPDFFGLVKNF